MKIDRLLSIIMYLMNRDLVSARELAGRFGVSVRTIQRDIEAIDLAGIPIVAIQGPNGGYGIMETFKLDRRLVTVDELYFIVTALAGMQSSLADPRISGTLEKMKGLLPPGSAGFPSESRGKLSLDFSMLGGGPRIKPVLRVLEKALEADRLVRFSYTSTKLETCERIVEPMTLVFKWRSWYLYGYCRFREDFRLFRVDRISAPEMLAGRFARRNKTFEEFTADSGGDVWGRTIRVKLRFDGCMKAFVTGYGPDDEFEACDDGSLILTTELPKDGSLYSFVLSFGRFVEILEPAYLRDSIRAAAEEIVGIYEKS